MSFLADKRNKKIFITLASVLSALLIAFIACLVYVNDYYRADTDAISAFAPVNYVEETTSKDGTMIFAPEDAKAGFIFYPGGKVEYKAYIPLMRACASEGILCVLVEMPFNLAVLDINAADGIKENYPEIDKWYIGGHSLGGSMAAAYLSDNAEDYIGLILLGSYSTKNLSEKGIAVLSVYGSEDKVLNREKYEKNKTNLPKDFTELVIDGGCHAYFGMYGEQSGDGAAAISNEQQIYITAAAISEFVNKF